MRLRIEREHERRDQSDQHPAAGRADEVPADVPRVTDDGHRGDRGVQRDQRGRVVDAGSRPRGSTRCRRGMPTRRATVVAATASGGATTAPSASAGRERDARHHPPGDQADATRSRTRPARPTAAGSRAGWPGSRSATCGSPRRRAAAAAARSARAPGVSVMSRKCGTNDRPIPTTTSTSGSDDSRTGARRRRRSRRPRPGRGCRARRAPRHCPDRRHQPSGCSCWCRPTTSWTWCTRSCRKYCASVSTVKSEPFDRRPGRCHSSSVDGREVARDALALDGQFVGDPRRVLLPVPLGERGLVLVPVGELRVVGVPHLRQAGAEHDADVADVAAVLERGPDLGRRADVGPRCLDGRAQRRDRRAHPCRHVGAGERRRVESAVRAGPVEHPGPVLRVGLGTRRGRHEATSFAGGALICTGTSNPLTVTAIGSD